MNKMKRNYWPVLFIGIFSFTFGMIVWTIISATKTPVHEDETFLQSYHDLDKNFNEVIFSNKKFNNKYNFKIDINKREFGLIINDMFLSQRVLEEKSNHKGIFINGKNKIKISIEDKNGNSVKDIDILLRVTRPTNHNNTTDFTNKDAQKIEASYLLDIDLPLKGNWNITATFKVNEDIGYFYIKSNAI